MATLDAPSRRAWSQLFDAASSGGAHLEEANSASSHKHFTSLNRGALRELSEAKYWLRVIIAGRLPACQHVDALAAEASELVAIVTTIVKRAVLTTSKTPSAASFLLCPFAFCLLPPPLSQ